MSATLPNRSISGTHLALLAKITALAICLCAACSPFRSAAPTATTSTHPTASIEPTASALPIPTPSEAPTPDQRTFDYNVIYQDGDFVIREAFLGTDAIWKKDFRMPATRIETSPGSLGLGRDMTCDEGSGSSTPCSQTIALALANGGSDKYTFRLGSLQGGNGVLLKNGRLLWSGGTNGAGSFAVLSSRRIGDEIAFDYLKSNWKTNLQERLWVIDSVLFTKGNTVALIADAFAPNAIRGKLAYFAIKSRKVRLVFDGKPVGAEYSEVFNQLSGWGGPPIQIAANGDFIDFFAQKGRDWYHVQAGYALPGGQ
jgi:hypothetical protein